MKKITILLNALIITTICFSCNNKSEKKTLVEKKQATNDESSFFKPQKDKKERTRLWKAAIDSGNFRAYNKLASPYLIRDQDLPELYYYSMIMANKYHCPEAYFTLSTILENPVDTRDMELLNNDEETKNLALYYLFKAKESGWVQAQSEIEQKFGKGKTKMNSAFFLKRLGSIKN